MMPENKEDKQNILTEPKCSDWTGTPPASTAICKAEIKTGDHSLTGAPEIMLAATGGTTAYGQVAWPIVSATPAELIATNQNFDFSLELGSPNSISLSAAGVFVGPVTSTTALTYITYVSLEAVVQSASGKELKAAFTSLTLDFYDANDNVSSLALGGSCLLPSKYDTGVNQARTKGSDKRLITLPTPVPPATAQVRLTISGTFDFYAKPAPGTGSSDWSRLLVRVQVWAA